MIEERKMEPRPRTLTPEMRERIALQLADELVEQKFIDAEDKQSSARDIAQQAGGPYQDGYQIAKRLDTYCGWDCNLEIAQVLDAWSSYAYDEIKAAIKTWAEANNIQPPFPPGTHVRFAGNQTGIIDKIYEYGVASYCIVQDGDDQAHDPHRHRLIINFEDVAPINPCLPPTSTS
jgi:hypothetical protein